MNTFSSLRLWFKTAYFVRGFLVVLISWSVVLILIHRFLIVPEHRGDPNAVELTIDLLKACAVCSVPVGFLVGFGMRGQDRATAFQARLKERFGSDPNLRGWWVDRHALRLYVYATTAFQPGAYPVEFEGIPVELVYRPASRA